MNNEEKHIINQIQMILKRHRHWGGTDWTYYTMSSDNVKKIEDLLQELYEVSSDE